MKAGTLNDFAETWAHLGRTVMVDLLDRAELVSVVVERANDDR